MRQLFFALAIGVSCAQPPVAPPFALDATFEYARSVAGATPLLSPSGLTRADYLSTIGGIVQHFRALQDDQGRIIDQYAKAEIQCELRQLFP